MKGKSILMLAVALGCGLVAMIGVQQVLSGDKKEEATTKPVLVAVEEIPPGVEIMDSMVTFKDMPVDAVPADAVTLPEQYHNRGLRVRTFPGTPILQAMLGEEGVFHVASDIPPGMRVASIAVSAEKAVSGFINPGDRVDIQVTYKKRVGTKTVERTKTVLQYIQVFAIDKTREMTEQDSESIYKHLSVLVDPQQANLLRLAESKGELHLTLRNPGDEEDTSVTDVTDADLDEAFAALRGDKEDEIDGDGDGEHNLRDIVQQQTQDEPADTDVEPEEQEEEEPPTWTMVIYHGGEKTVEEIPLPNPNPDQPDATTTEPNQDPQEPKPAAS